MYASYIFDPDWKYWRSIARDSSRVWLTGNFPTVICEAHIYNLMLNSIQKKKEIEEKYNA
jgi:sRNA-binding protein